MANGTESADTIEARLAALPAGDAHARDQVDLLSELGWRVREQPGQGSTFTVRLRGFDPNEESWKGAQL